jgi:hypothetical protein
MEMLKHIDGDILGAVFVIGTIGIFVSFIVVVVSIARTWNNIAVVRMNQTLVQDLLEKGYTVDDIERLAYGGQNWSRKFRQLFHSAKSQISSLHRRRYRNHYENQPVPPMKQTA